MISLKIAAHRGILGGYLCKELRLYVLGRAPIFFFFPPSNSIRPMEISIYCFFTVLNLIMTKLREERIL